MHFLDGSIQTKRLELKASEGPPTSSETSSLVQQPQYQLTSTQQLFAKCIIYIVLFSFLASFARRLLLLFPFYKKETETQKAGTPAPSFSGQEEAELGSVSLTSASTFFFFAAPQACRILLLRPGIKPMTSTAEVVAAVQSLSLVQTLWEPMDCSMPGLPILHNLIELVQIHVH